MFVVSEKIGDRASVYEVFSNLLNADAWSSLLHSPEASAYFNQTNIDNWSIYSSFSDILGHRKLEIEIEGHNLTINQHPHPIFTQVLRNIKKGSLGDDSAKAKVLPESDPSYTIHSKRIKKALDLLKKICPELYNVIDQYLHEIVLVDHNASFRGATSYNSRGLSYFQPKEHWDHLVWAEELLHESTHNFLHTLLTFDPLITSSNALTLAVPGPFRPDLRHHFGNFQALHVISRLVSLNKVLAEAGLSSERLKQRNLELISRGAKPYEALASEVTFSNVGQALFDEEVAPCFN